MLRFQRASINQGTVIYESNPIIVKNTAALSITVRFSIRQKSIHFIQMEPSEFTLSPVILLFIYLFIDLLILYFNYFTFRVLHNLFVLL